MKNILLAISGLTPQIVTEALYALSIQKGITIDEIYIVTTNRGKEVILGKDKHPQTPSIPLLSEIKNFCATYNIPVPKFTNSNKHIIVAEEESLILHDIRNDKENKLFPNKLAEVLKKLTLTSNNTIHAVLSGGRKSMSAHLALSLSLFGRSQDKLYHILTDEKYEFGNFYPLNKAEANALVIAEIPFVRLRALMNENYDRINTYTDLVEKTQKQVSFLTDSRKLIINLADRTIVYGNKKITIQPFELALYLRFAEEKISKHKGFNISEITSKEFAKELQTILEEKYNHYFEQKDKIHWTNRGLSSEYFRSKRTKVNNKLKTLFDEVELTEQFLIKSKKEWGNTTYYITANKNKIGINYE